MNCARWDLCGGRSVMGVSTAIARGFFADAKTGIPFQARAFALGRFATVRKRPPSRQP